MDDSTNTQETAEASALKEIAERLALRSHIADRRRELNEASRHFAHVAELANEGPEKNDAAARVIVANAFLAVLDSLAVS